MKLTIGYYEHYCTEPDDMCGGEVLSRTGDVSLVRKIALFNDKGRPMGLGLPQLKTREGALAWADQHGHEVTNRDA